MYDFGKEAFKLIRPSDEKNNPQLIKPNGRYIKIHLLNPFVAFPTH